MPQFDAATFFAQISLFVLFFLCFYLVNTKELLPSIARPLKLEQKLGVLFKTLGRLARLSFIVYGYRPRSVLLVFCSREFLILKSLKSCTGVLTNSFFQAHVWLAGTRVTINLVTRRLMRVYLTLLSSAF